MAGHVDKVREELIPIGKDDQKNIQQFHLRNIGKMIEANEADVRSEMTGIYINKNKQIIDTGRLKDSHYTKEHMTKHQEELINVIKQNAKDKGNK